MDTIKFVMISDSSNFIEKIIRIDLSIAEKKERLKMLINAINVTIKMCNLEHCLLNSFSVNDTYYNRHSNKKLFKVLDSKILQK